MASTRDLRRRIKSIKNTSQITKAMQMVSATKMRRAQNQALSGRPYTEILSYALSQVSLKVLLEDEKKASLIHPFLKENTSSKIAILLFSTDKGLCGSLNTNLFRLILSSPLLRSNVENIYFYTIGRKGRDFIVRTKRNLVGDFENKERIEFIDAANLRKFFSNAFLNNEIGQVYLLYPNFISTLRQEANLIKILPIDKTSLTNPIIDQPLEDKMIKETISENKEKEFLFEPNLDQVLDFALTHLLDIEIYQAFLETKASEHSARMIAMQNATNNAKDLVADLTITYNGMRQDNITRELLEIVSAGAALE